MSESNTERVHLFANGHEAGLWMEKNCDRCQKEQGCAIQIPIVRAYVTDGTATAKEAAILGLPSFYTGIDRCPEFIARAADTTEGR